MTKILLVEDNELNRDMLSRRLERKGFEMMTAEDGLQGVKLACSEAPDLILMDMNLPGIDGWEATRQIRAWEEYTHVPIIAVTAHTMSVDYERAISAGCDQYEPKPINLPRLLEKMHDLLGQ
ncbi:response regulator [Neptunomonas antarctica]|uniref:Response regulator receiver domain-containing protein n=1 Tax=Neptunomonas antarctica TaxID=619304 RepID=A0A1N7LZW5_9GAMM|nr:response regulator [Neptunomonas antarctica]SIS79385.1 Response regulator receiver domain-containing protein [Neptunomonas antarctica]